LILVLILEFCLRPKWHYLLKSKLELKGR
jgi:hypothetical protein